MIFLIPQFIYPIEYNIKNIKKYLRWEKSNAVVSYSAADKNEWIGSGRVW